ncbi:MAG: hypothetical protein ACRYHQ_03340 [Janthinobacterium lividum]
MSKIKTGSGSSAWLVPADAIDWKHAVALQLWSVKSDRNAQRLTSESLNISLLDASGVRYGLTVIFEDDTWVWIDMTAGLEEAIRGIQRVSAEHDIPIRQLGDDEQLKAAGY